MLSLSSWVSDSMEHYYSVRRHYPPFLLVDRKTRDVFKSAFEAEGCEGLCTLDPLSFRSVLIETLGCARDVSGRFESCCRLCVYPLVLLVGDRHSPATWRTQFMGVTNVYDSLAESSGYARRDHYLDDRELIRRAKAALVELHSVLGLTSGGRGRMFDTSESPRLEWESLRDTILRKQDWPDVEETCVC